MAAPEMLERLVQLATEIGLLQSKLILLVGGPQAGKTALLVEFAGRMDTNILCVGSELGRRLAAIGCRAPGALAATKSLMAQARLQPPAALVAHAATIFSQAAQGPEGVEGMTAFMQKRKPNWVPQ